MYRKVMKHSNPTYTMSWALRQIVQNIYLLALDGLCEAHMVYNVLGTLRIYNGDGKDDA